MGIFDKFKLGLNKSSKNLSQGLNNLFFKKKIDEETLNELEDFLIQSDVGVESAKELREKFNNTKIDPKNSEKNEIFKIFSNYASEILKPLEKNLENINKNKIFDRGIEIFYSKPGEEIVLRNDGSFGILLKERESHILDKRTVEDGEFRIRENKIICKDDSNW